MNTYPEVMNALEDAINNAFREFQKKLGIEDGDIPPCLYRAIENKQDDLACAILKAMDWQEENAPRITYEQAYAPDTDTTFIMKHTHVWNDEVKREVTGFYCGKPNDKCFEEYKNAGTVAEY